MHLLVVRSAFLALLICGLLSLGECIKEANFFAAGSFTAFTLFALACFMAAMKVEDNQ